MKNHVFSKIKSPHKFVGVLFFLALLNFGCTNDYYWDDEQNNSEWSKIQNEEFGFSMELPPYLNYLQRGDPRLRLSRDLVLLSNNSTISVLIKEVDSPTLDDAVIWGYFDFDMDQNTEGLQPGNGYKELLFQQETLNTIPIIKRRYTSHGLNGYIVEEVYMAENNKFIEIQFTEHESFFEDFYPDFERILNSFQLID